MKFTPAKKIFTLVSFVTLITAFVLYRAGVFDKYLSGNSYSIQSSPNGGAMNNSSTDTVPSQKKDSLAVKKDTTKQPIMWSGSKSSRIISPDDFKTLAPDSTKSSDSLIKKKIDSIMTAPKKTVVMPSTKSAPVFKPAQEEQNELIRLIKIYQGDSAGLRRALERYFKVRN